MTIPFVRTSFASMLYHTLTTGALGLVAVVTKLLALAQYDNPIIVKNQCLNFVNMIGSS